MFGRILLNVNIQGRPLFYHSDILEAGFIFSEEESRHITVSLRFKEGDTLYVTDGAGKVASCRIKSGNPKKTEVAVLEVEQKPQSRIYRRLIVSPPKAGERLDWMVEKAVEIGVNEILFLETRNSERDKVNLERLHKIAVSAMKQSKQVYLPSIKEMVKWKTFMTQQIAGVKLIAHLGENAASITSKLSQHINQVSILIGPEGDFSAEEVKQSEQMGYASVSLGANVLRTETAVVYALVCLNTFN